MNVQLFGIQDKALQEACFRAYNDWLAEFVSYDPSRFVGLGLICLMDVPDGVKELQRCAKKGLKGAMIWASPPEDHDHGDPIYDPFWAAAQDLNMPLSLHILTGRAQESRGDPRSTRIARYMSLPHEVQRAISTMISCGVLERFPGLKIVSSENDIGWVPHFLARLDHAFKKFRSYGNEGAMPHTDVMRSIELLGHEVISGQRYSLGVHSSARTSLNSCRIFCHESPPSWLQNTWPYRLLASTRSGSDGWVARQMM